ncbi:MAG: MBL fold metallo-hydrolase [Candidatus Hermodarchaeota archaeon]
MTSITVYDGAKTIGGNKIYINEKEKGLFLDFGMNFKKYSLYFQEYLSSRGNRGIFDLIHLNLIPKLNIYRRDLIPSDLDISKFPKLTINAILLSHAHMDHFGNIGLLNSRYPIVLSPSTLAILKGLLDCSKAMLGSDVAYYSLKKQKTDGRILETERNRDIGRNFICTEKISGEFEDYIEERVKKRTTLEKGNIEYLKESPLDFEITPFEIDHSIFGSTAYLVSGETTIAYTGDFRLHGEKGEYSEKFVNQAKNASVLIIEGTRTAKEDISESEEIVFENCRRTAEVAKGLIIADFSARNFERLETFQKIAIKLGRSLVIPSKDAYLLNALEKADGINRIKDLYIYNDLKSIKRNWETILLNDQPYIQTIDPKEISRDPENFIICFSYLDMKNLLDINPPTGTYIYSSSEAFEEESEFDFVRLNNWLNYFNFKIYGFKIIEEKGKEKPIFTKGFHASGHASKKDLIWAIDTIDPEIIIPVHTDNPEWFKETYENAVMLEDGQTHKL